MRATRYIIYNTYRNIQDSQPVGAVMLLKYDVEQTPELRVHSFAIKKQGAPTLRLAADTEEAAARWTILIREAVERNNQVGKVNSSVQPSNSHERKIYFNIFLYIICQVTPLLFSNESRIYVTT